MKTYVGGVWDRKKWQGERDGKHVPKGFAKVNVGDALAKFHTASGKGLPAGIAAADALEKQLKAYVVHLKKQKGYNVPAKGKEPDYKGLVDRIENRLIDVDIADYMTRAKHWVAKAKNYKSARDTAVTEVTEAMAEMVQAKQATEDSVGAVPKGWKPSNRKALLQSITELYNTLSAVEYVSSAVSEREVKDLTGLESTLSDVGFNENLMTKLSAIVLGLPASI